jgi:lipoprotein-anchoring transpeptidase ErfK/SrfK
VARAYPAAVQTSEGKNFSLRPGDILIDTARHRLVFAVSSDRVESFPVAVGKQGASWKGTAIVGRKVAFPTWRPTARMRSRERHLPSFVPPGLQNPLGTCAIYLYRNGHDTMFRIHGTNAPWSIGKSVSHGCIRMLNSSVEHLYDAVRLGAHVTVQ